MPAPQQNQIPVYKETANIPRPNTAYHLHREGRDTGTALARLLGAIPEVAQGVDQSNEPSRAEQEQLAALAAMGATRDRLRLAKGGRVFGMLNSRESTMDSYDLNRGRRDADLLAGELRDAYAASGLADNDDPVAFQAFAEQWRNDIFENRLSGVTPSYQHGYITRIGSVFEDMAKAHAGNLDSFISSRSKRAMQSRINQKVDLELAVDRERGAFGNFMDSIMGAESGGNYNAFHGNGNNTRIRFTDMTIAEVIDWQESGVWERLGARSSAVGKYQFVKNTLKETVRSLGIDPETTRFTPAVQDQLIFHRLMTARNLEGFLKGDITAEEFLDKHLAYEFAGLKKTSGSGAYDGDGLNVANLSSRKSLAALLAFREAYIQDPKGLLKRSKDQKQVIARSGPGVTPGQSAEENPQATVAQDIETAEVEYGVSQVEARAAVADALIKAMDANPAHAERDDLEDLMAAWKLGQQDRSRVFDSRDSIRQRQEFIRQNTRRQEQAHIDDLSERFLTGGDTDALEELKGLDDDTYGRLMELQANPIDPMTSEEFAEMYPEDEIDFEYRDFRKAALKAYLNGFIDQASFQKIMERHRMHHETKSILEMPGVQAFVNTLTATLPDTNKRDFREQLKLVVTDLRAANGGERPPFLEVLAKAQELYALQQSQVATEQPQILEELTQGMNNRRGRNQATE